MQRKSRRTMDRGNGYLRDMTVVRVSAIGTNKISFGSVRMSLPVEGQVSLVPGMLASQSGTFRSFNASRIVLVFGGPSPSTQAIGNG
jgi:hypothetical protein